MKPNFQVPRMAKRKPRFRKCNTGAAGFVKAASATSSPYGAHVLRKRISLLPRITDPGFGLPI